MELKKAAAVCLISLFSATLVLLIAHALDVQTASRLEPKLDELIAEVRALHKAGGMTAEADGAAADDPAGDCLVVYYFHGNTRCETCQAIESQSHETVQSNFAPQLKSGEVVWKIINYEQPAAAPLAKKFEIIAPTVVLAKRKDGKITDWKRLNQVWSLVGDKPAFAKYIGEQTSLMLKPAAETQADPPNIPIPSPSDIIPIPETNQGETR
jgi:hypothetical protein